MEPKTQYIIEIIIEIKKFRKASLGRERDSLLLLLQISNSSKASN